MKKHFAKFALAALVLTGAILSAAPAHAIAYYDSYGRPYYYNTWGQPVYYDTGYNASTAYVAPAAVVPATTYTQATYSAAQPVYSSTVYQPELAAVPVPADSTQTTYQYYYPDGTTASTTYVSQTSAVPVAAGVCRQSSRTVKQYGEIQTRYVTECQQADGTWIEQ